MRGDKISNANANAIANIINLGIVCLMFNLIDFIIEILYPSVAERFKLLF